MTRPVQETLDQALVQPAVPRVWAHLGCGGYVLFRIAGGWCLSCEAGPLRPDQYAKPGAAVPAGPGSAERAAPSASRSEAA